MKIAILCQEEPNFYSQYLREFINIRKDNIKIIIISGSRKEGLKSKSFTSFFFNEYKRILMYGLSGYIKIALKYILFNIIKFIGLYGSVFDFLSIYRIAKENKINTIILNDFNENVISNLLLEYSIELTINQTDFIISKKIINLNKKGVLARHGALLPDFRGRVASFWAHYHDNPNYYITVYFIDEMIDSGNVVYSEKLEIDSENEYYDILKSIFNKSAAVLSHAIDLIEKKNYTPVKIDISKSKLYTLPEVNELIEYRKILKIRKRKIRLI